MFDLQYLCKAMDDVRAITGRRAVQIVCGKQAYEEIAGLLGVRPARRCWLSTMMRHKPMELFGAEVVCYPEAPGESVSIFTARHYHG